MHHTVLLETAIDYLNVRSHLDSQDSTQPLWYIDATFGGGGHTREIINRGGRVIAFDFDEETYLQGLKTFDQEIKNNQLVLIRENFVYLQRELQCLRQEQPQLFNSAAPNSTDQPLIGGVLFDFGTNSDQLQSVTRGFSFVGDGNLDMRLDQRLAVTARDLLMALPEEQLSRMMAEYGGERQARQIARAITQTRQEQGEDAFRSNASLVELIVRIKDRADSPRRAKNGGRLGDRGHHLHPATQVFQALRIAVNDEIGNIERALPQAFASLAPSGRLVTIAFHEGEDRPVKHFMRQLSQEAGDQITLLTKKPLAPDETELRQNQRARSAKLRALEKNY